MVKSAMGAAIDIQMILHQVVEGIQGLHSRGVLHRDIKPENLLVETGSGTPRVRVIDLGCGCHHNSGVYSEFSVVSEFNSKLKGSGFDPQCLQPNLIYPIEQDAP
ncbi:unnamed protein product [Boreogadus saida]